MSLRRPHMNSNSDPPPLAYRVKPFCKSIGIGRTKFYQLAQRDMLRATSPSADIAATATLISRCAAEIPAEKIDWLWPDRIARGKHTCIAGEPGTGQEPTVDRHRGCRDNRRGVAVRRGPSAAR